MNLMVFEVFLMCVCVCVCDFLFTGLKKEHVWRLMYRFWVAISDKKVSQDMDVQETSYY